MDAQQGTYISPDGRHRWDPQAQRWVPVEVSAAPPAGPGSGALEPPVEPEPMGGELFLETLAHAKPDTPKGSESGNMHARLANGAAVLMASDSMAGRRP